MARRAAILAVLLVLAACTSAHPRPPSTVSESPAYAGPYSPPTVAASSTLPCAEFVDTDPPPVSLEIVLGVVALPASPGSPALGTSRTGYSGSLRLFAKTGLLIRARSVVDLSVPEQPGQLSIGWGKPGVPSKHLRIPGCTAPTSTGWLAYAGGYWIDRTGCVAVVVNSGDKQQLVHIGLGTPCAGQRPPAEPSQS